MLKKNCKKFRLTEKFRHFIHDDFKFLITDFIFDIKYHIGKFKTNVFIRGAGPTALLGIKS